MEDDIKVMYILHIVPNKDVEISKMYAGTKMVANKAAVAYMSFI